MEFEILINPPQHVFEQIVYWTGETEQWGFQLNDYKFWSSAFDKFWLYVIVEKGTSNLVASVSLARWDVENEEPLYSVGMYYCMQKYRGMGQASQIFKQVMDRIGENDNAVLTGVVKMSDKYAKTFGFDKITSYYHVSVSIKMENLLIPQEASNDFITKVWTDVDFNKLMDYDKTICTRDRKLIMNKWFKLDDTFTRVVMNKDGQICGYSTIRIVSKNRLSVAPFYANSLYSAKRLLKDLLDNIPNVTKFASIGFLYPETNTDGTRLCETFSKDNKCETIPFLKIQFTKKFIDFPSEKVYSMSDCAHQFV